MENKASMAGSGNAEQTMKPGASALAEAPVGEPAACEASNAREIALGERTKVENRVAYKIAGSADSICVEQTALPLMDDRSHGLFVLFRLDDGRKQLRFAPDPSKLISWRGYTIEFGLEQVDLEDPYEGEPTVWVTVNRDL